MIKITSSMTKALFFDFFKKGERFNVGTIMVKMGVSRPTATNLVSSLLTARKIYPVFQIGDKHKWYAVK